MKHFVFCLFCFSSLAQSFPEDWIGTYEGEMLVSTKNSKQYVDVRLSIKPTKTDSLWNYEMIYFKNKAIVVEKKYVIKKDKQGAFSIDEGGIIIPMFFSNNCFYDHYCVDSLYFNSILSFERKNVLQFKLFGGSLQIENQIKSSHENIIVRAYSPSFSQHVILKRKKK